MKTIENGARPTVLFDLDGTLLPMDMDLFEKAYFKGLCTVLPEFPPKELVAHVWAGTKAMAMNDGTKTNREAFAEVFSGNMGIDYYEKEDSFLEYYKSGFQKCVETCQVTELSKELVHTLQKKGYNVAIATNPLFPQIATYSRLRWLGMEAGEFPLVTTFEDSHYAKPNPKYYLEVCEKLGVKPEDCIMIGNDVAEDGVAASLGMRVILVKDCLLNKKDLPTDSFEMGTLEEVKAWADALPERE